jgi:hypothetical protein
MKCFAGKKRLFVALMALKWLVVGTGCCCKWFNSSAYAPTQPVYYTQPAAAPATYYTAPATTVAPTVVQAPPCAPAPVVTQPCCPCQCQ